LNREICRSSSNRFFEIADKQVAALANEHVVIAGQQVRVIKIMFFSQEWLEYYYQSSIGGLASSFAKTMKCRRTTLFVVTFCLCAMLIGYCLCYTYVWIPVNTFPLDYLVLNIVVSLVHGPFQYYRLHHSLFAKQWLTYYCIFMVLVFAIIGLGTVTNHGYIYMRQLGELWSLIPDGEKLNLRIDIENELRCCGWLNFTTSETCEMMGSLDRFETCDIALSGTIRGFSGGLTFGIIAVFLSQIFVGGCAIWIQRRLVAALQAMERQSQLRQSL
jgi:hypothetical protein